MLRPLGLARSVFVLSTVLASWRCSGSPAGPSAALSGVWGGDHIALTVAETDTHIEFDCAHGDIPGSITVDAQHTFDVPGTYVREHGGPIRVGEAPDSHPAAYVGSVTATTMALTVRLTDTNEVVGTFCLVTRHNRSSAEVPVAARRIFRHALTTARSCGVSQE
jgi:hypothetical protein